MPGPPLFQRSPRLLPPVPTPTVEIPAPPSRPSLPAGNLSSALLMILPALAGALVMLLIARGRGGNPWFYVGMSLPMVAISAILQVGRAMMQGRAHEQQLAERERRYRELLDRLAAQVQGAIDEQRQILCDQDPDLLTCAARAAERSPRLWERSPGDPDFLALRLGIGSLPAAAKLKVPPQPGAEEPDPLLLEALQLPERFAEVSGVPITIPLREAGVVGLVGPRPALLAALRALLAQLAVHHAPDEAQLAALFPEEEAAEWAWLRWLPHVWASGQERLLAADPDGVDRLATRLYDRLQRRKQRASQRLRGEATPPSTWLTVVLGDLSLVEREPVLPLLLREGADLGAVTILLAARREELPKECRAIIQVDGERGTLILTAPALVERSFTPDQATAEAAEALSRSLAPVRPHQLAAPAEIPTRVDLLELLRIGRVAELDLLTAWREAEPYRSLAVPLGLGAGGERLLIDMHERGHGPHGLVAGATGSGKSELLQSLVVALACQFHPHEVALVLVDYKGGGMANAFQGLPHLVGTITNLGGNLTRRALSALKAELRRRQRLLAEAGVNALDAYMKLRRRGQPLVPLPHLLIIVDEFAELKSDQPDFMRELISAVRVGRSLGVHLILATQKPAGVVDEQIWSNARFRLCLRVERPEDSQEVLKTPDAASITGAGRAFFQVGNNERYELVQAGWGGAPYQPDAKAGPVQATIAEVGLDGTRYPLRTGPAAVVAATDGLSQLTALVDQIREVAAQAGIAPLAGPWLPPLPEAIPLDAVLPAGEGFDGAGWRSASEWLAAPVGLLDNPEEQRQVPLGLDLGKEGHLAVYGAPGSGKTTFLQSLVMGLALRYSPADCQLYLVDGGGRSLSVLGGLPHVGAVILADEAERIQRLMRLLTLALEERKGRLGEAGVNTLAAYRQAGFEPLPALVVLIDSYPTIAQTYPEAEELLAQVAREGGGLGIHLVLAATGPGQIRTKVAANLALAVALQLADRGDYQAVAGRTNGLEPAAIPGRGLIKGAPPLEFQTALPAEGESEWQRARALRSRCEALSAAWTGPRPTPVQTLPEVVALADLLDGEGEPACALDVESLEPFAIPLAEGPHFLVTGPVESGKTTLLQAWALALADRSSPARLQVFLLDLGAGGLAPLRTLPHVQAYAADPAEAEVLLERLEAEIQERRGAPEPPGELLVLIDDLESFRDAGPSPVRERLEQMVRKERGVGLHLVAAGLASSLTQLGYEGLVKGLKEGQVGVILGTTEHTDLQLLNMRMPGEPGRLLPAGLGFYTRRGRWRRIKVATPQADLATLVERITGRWLARHEEEV